MGGTGGKVDAAAAGGGAPASGAAARRGWNTVRKKRWKGMRKGRFMQDRTGYGVHWGGCAAGWVHGDGCWESGERALQPSPARPVDAGLCRSGSWELRRRSIAAEISRPCHQGRPGHQCRWALQRESKKRCSWNSRFTASCSPLGLTPCHRPAQGRLRCHQGLSVK